MEFLLRQKAGRMDTPPIHLDSVILVNALFDLASSVVGVFDMFWADADDDNGVGTGFNETVCLGMAAGVPECEHPGGYCQQSLDPHICSAAYEYCIASVGRPFWSKVVEGGFDP